jgi:hypothetical protein
MRHWGPTCSPHCATRVRLAGEEYVTGVRLAHLTAQLGYGSQVWNTSLGSGLYSPHCATRVRLAGFGMRLLLWYALLTAVLSPMGLRPPAE